MKLIDMHCDTIFEMMQKGQNNLRKNELCVDLERLRKADSMAQFFACFINMKRYEGADRFEQAYHHVLEMIAYAKDKFERCADEIQLARNFAELERTANDGKIAAFLTVEEGGVINGKMSHLEELYRQGIRLITLTWNFENCIGFPNSKDAKNMQLGLKPFGKEVVERMNELGMLIDVSHLSDGGFWDVLKCSRKPVVASHSNARTLCPHPRNLTDEMIRALAENGGVAGMNLFPVFIKEGGKANIDDLIHHIEHMYYIGGEDIVAIGTDFDGFDEGELGINHMGEMDILYHALKKRKFNDGQIEKFWNKNAIRVIKEL